MSDDTIEFNNKGLKELIEAFSTIPEIKIGIIEDKIRSQESGDVVMKQGGKDVYRENSKSPNNASIGAAHEFGTETLPQRSFLRMPLTLKLNKYLEESGAFDKETLAEVLKEKTLIPWAKKVAIVAESVVIDAFDTGGFGKWKKSDMTNKKVHQTLVETQQLRESIMSEVKE